MAQLAIFLLQSADQSVTAKSISQLAQIDR